MLPLQKLHINSQPSADAAESEESHATDADDEEENNVDPELENMWVPAGLHPELAPSEWQAFVDEKLAAIRNSHEAQQQSRISRNPSRLAHVVAAPEEYVDAAAILDKRRRISATERRKSVMELSKEFEMEDIDANDVPALTPTVVPTEQPAENSEETRTPSLRRVRSSKAAAPDLKAGATSLRRSRHRLRKPDNRAHSEPEHDQSPTPATPEVPTPSPSHISRVRPPLKVSISKAMATTAEQPPSPSAATPSPNASGMLGYRRKMHSDKKTGKKVESEAHRDVPVYRDPEGHREVEVHQETEGHKEAEVHREPEFSREPGVYREPEAHRDRDLDLNRESEVRRETGMHRSAKPDVGPVSINVDPGTPTPDASLTASPGLNVGDSVPGEPSTPLSSTTPDIQHMSPESPKEKDAAREAEEIAKTYNSLEGRSPPVPQPATHLSTKEKTPPGTPLTPTSATSTKQIFSGSSPDATEEDSRGDESKDKKWKWLDPKHDPKPKSESKPKKTASEAKDKTMKSFTNLFKKRDARKQASHKSQREDSKSKVTAQNPDSPKKEQTEKPQSKDSGKKDLLKANSEVPRSDTPSSEREATTSPTKETPTSSTGEARSRPSPSGRRGHSRNVSRVANEAFDHTQPEQSEKNSSMGGVTAHPEIKLPYDIPAHQVSDRAYVMMHHRFPLHIERAIYRLSHMKLANPRQPLRQQVLLSNFMYAYLNLINYSYQQQQLAQLEEQKQQQGGLGVLEELQIQQLKRLGNSNYERDGMYASNETDDASSSSSSEDEMDTWKNDGMDEDETMTMY